MKKVKTDKIYRPEILPAHESGVRRLIADSRGEPYIALKTLEEAKLYSDGVAILEGDWGGQIYVVIPVRLINCSEDKLSTLSRDLDSIVWACNDGEGARIYFERLPTGATVAGGMGGAIVSNKIWIHKEFIKLKLDSEIKEIVDGKLDKISIKIQKGQNDFFSR